MSYSQVKSQVNVPINAEKLCLNLVKAESEKDVIFILERVGLWHNEDNWAFYGDNENNFSIIGNQASLPETAIAEKIVNSVDAMLIRESLRRNVEPTISVAPQSIVEAVNEFFNISQGSLSNIGAGLRTELSKNIGFVATGLATGKKAPGKKEAPCYVIFDLGEGQTPKNMPSTLLSLSKSNKLRIPFVQGKFNMGGTGVLQFCGHQNLQLIISRKDPQIAKNDNDDTKDYWGFTVVRRENPREGRRSSAYTYLTINGKVPMFKANNLSILPGDYPKAYGRNMEWGTYIKLYDYQISGGLRSIISFDLYDRLCLLLPRIALPVRFYERRPDYRGHSMESTMSGLNVRLDEDRNSNLEENFPSSSTMTVLGEKMSCLIYAFKKGQSEKYRKDEGIIFTVNGQTHGSISKYFFERRAVGMSYLADSILVSIDCSFLSTVAREDLFMNSRDRLRNCDLKNEIEKKLEELLSKHPGLRGLREKRRREEIESKVEDSKPLKEVLENIIRKSPSLVALFIPGSKIKNPFDLRNVGPQTLYVGKEFPTYFKLKLDGVKQCPINRRFRVQYETDATNDYFERDNCPGKFELYLGQEKVESVIHLWNGVATLTVSLPENITLSAVLEYKSMIEDKTQFKPFEETFKVRVIAEVTEQESLPGTRTKPPSDVAGNSHKTPSSLALPQVLEVHKNEWDNYQFNSQSALKIKYAEEGYDFYVNMDNVHLLSEAKARAQEEAKLLQERFKYAMVLVGLALLKDISNLKDNAQTEMYEKVSEITMKLSPIVLPMISFLGDLSIDG